MATDSKATTKKAIPRQPGLMLCALIGEAFDDPKWIFEPKYDGLRVLCQAQGKNVQLISRNDKSQNLQFPDIVEAAAKALNRPAVLDGEVVCLDKQGMSSFRQLQQRFHLQDRAVILDRMKAHPAYYYVFDILWYDGQDLRPLPLEQRKQILNDSVQWSDRIRQTPDTPAVGKKMFADACRRHAEGIVAKRLQSPYVAARNGDWVKIKCATRQEFVIGGFTDPQRSRAGLGSLLVGYYDDDGNFRYAGKVGTGFTDQMLKDLRHRLDQLEQEDTPFIDGQTPRGAGIHWVAPKLVGEVAFSEWTQNDLLRQPRFQGLRPDKKPKDVKAERVTAPRPKRK